MTGPIERRLELLAADIVDQSVAQIAQAQAALQTQLAETVSGVLLKGSRVVPVGPFTAALQAAGDHMLAHGSGQLTGWALRETAGVVVTVIMHDGADASAPEIGSARISANQTDHGPIAGEGGIFFTQGLYVEVVGGGTLGGAVYLRGN